MAYQISRRKIMLTAGLLLSFGLCAQTSNCSLDPNVATPNQVVIAANAFNAAEATGINYLKLPLCVGSVVSLCRTAVKSQTVYNALHAGTLARNQLLTDIQANTPLPLTLIQALSTAVSTLQALAPATSN